MKHGCIVSAAVGCLLYTASLSAQTTNPPPAAPSEGFLEKAGIKPIGDWQVDPNQQQVNAAGQRVGINRPDVQATSPTGQRVYIEYDTSASTRAAGHQQRILANDPSGMFVLKTVN